MGFIPKATWFLGNAKCNVSCFCQVPLMAPSDMSLGTEMPVVPCFLPEQINSSYSPKCLWFLPLSFAQVMHALGFKNQNSAAWITHPSEKGTSTLVFLELKVASIKSKPYVPWGGGAGRVEEDGSTLAVQPWITDPQWSLGQAFLALLWNLPSLAVLLCLIDRTRKNNFLTIAKSPEALITLLYFWNSILVILKKVPFSLPRLAQSTMWQ